MIPFLVADRPISLSIIKGISLPPGAKIGILTQAATTSPQFQEIYAQYPFATKVVYPNGQPIDSVIADRTVKMVDSGVFGKNGCKLTYDELFRAYDAMNAEYGIIIDSLRNAKKTLESAKEAMRTYRKAKHRFELVGVAQGKTASQYYQCYDALQRLGFDHIAIGGLLQKRENTVRYVHVRCKELMDEVLRGVRERFDPEWLFALGVFHPGRLDMFVEHGVWGSDYKGWIFNYEKKEKVIELIQEGKLATQARVALKDLKIGEVRATTEQELRFSLTRACVERRVMNRLHDRRLLVIGCSARKRRVEKKIAAWELYDGTVFRTLKALQRKGLMPSGTDILILSAEHGIISPETRIRFYDRKMDATRAKELHSKNVEVLRKATSATEYREVFLCLGKTYRDSLLPHAAWADGIKVRVAKGKIGEKLMRLKRWVVGKR
jgi:hypothetical protein